MAQNGPILEVRDLQSSFFTENTELRAVDGLSFQLHAGQTLGIVGEAGSGKSVTSLSLIDLLPKPTGQVVGGEILFQGQNLRQLPEKELHRIRGNQISMIFQEPMTSLNPVRTIGRQLMEVYKIHSPSLSGRQMRERCIKLLQEVGIPEAERRLLDYPHQLSGGMRQRVVIAMALACEPDVLIADEPTTALDVTIQAQILDLMQRLQEQHGMAIIFITHDLGVIAELADQVLVMYGGRMAEYGSVDQIFYEARHPYTRGLLQAIPRLDRRPKTQLPTIEGMVPSLIDMPQACRFENRCPHRQELCQRQRPRIEAINAQHQVACLRWRDIEEEGQR